MRAKLRFGGSLRQPRTCEADELHAEPRNPCLRRMAIILEIEHETEPIRERGYDINAIRCYVANSRNATAKKAAIVATVPPTRAMR